MKSPSVADVEGPWADTGVDTDLTDRCKQAWNVPVNELTNGMLATLLRQRTGLPVVVPEVQKRIDCNFTDDTELYDDELFEALRSATQP